MRAKKTRIAVRFLWSGVLAGIMAVTLMGCRNMPATKEVLVISKDGTARAVICIGSNAAPVVRFAAEELQKYLNKATGGDFQIVPETFVNGEQARIVLGDNAESRAAGLDVDKVRQDGFYIHSLSNTIFLTGRDDTAASVKNMKRVAYTQVERGTLNAVYHFLREYLGVRWVFPGEVGEYVPSNPTVRIPPVALKKEPSFAMRTQYPVHFRSRDMQDLFGGNACAEYDLFLLRSGFSSWRMPTSHYFTPKESAARWMETHPEFFAWDKRTGKRMTEITPAHGWRMCFSNPDLALEVARDAMAYFGGQPAATRGVSENQLQRYGYKKESFAINPSDADMACRCDECEKYNCAPDDVHGDYSDLIWLYNTRVADEVAKHYPDAIISTWSYSNYGNIPKSLDKAPANTRVYLVTVGPFGWQEKERRAKAMQRMREWHRFSGHKLYEWVNMQVRACRPAILGGVPSPVVNAMSRWLKDIYPYMDGVYLCNDETDVYSFEAANTYMFFNLAWDMDRDIEELMSDYYQSAYGPKAGVIIRGIEKRFEEIWYQAFFTPRVRMGITMVGDKSTLPTTAEIWEDIYNDEVVNDLKAEMERAVAAARGTEFAGRVEIFAKYYFGTFLEHKSKYSSALNMADDMATTAVRARSAIAIDGKMDEACWTNAPAVDMAGVEDGVKPNVDTEVRILYDDEHLYVFFRCQEPEIARLRALATKDDLSVLWRDDEVEIFLDVEGRRRNYFQMLANAAGVFQDIRHVGGYMDNDWRSGARVAAGRCESGWTLEMALPFSAMGVKAPQANTSWVANFCRGRALMDAKPGESQFLSWSRLLKGGFQQPMKFGRLYFSEDGVAPVQRKNVIQNGDFSDGFKHWGGKQCRIDKEERFLAKQSARLEATKEDPSTAIIYGFPKGSLKPDTPYVLTFYIKTENVEPLPGFEDKLYAGAHGEIFIRSRGQLFTPEISIRGTQDWRKYALRVTTENVIPEKTTLRFRLHSATGIMWVENVMLMEEGGDV